MPWQRPGPMRTLGTRLPSTQTVHERVWGGLQPRSGRPVIIPPRNVGMKKDKSRPERYRLLMQKMKPDVLKGPEADMDLYMPPGLAPQALSYVNARRQRRRG